MTAFRKQKIVSLQKNKITNPMPALGKGSRFLGASDRLKGQSLNLYTVLLFTVKTLDKYLFSESK